jgi:hypothetical protein
VATALSAQALGWLDRQAAVFAARAAAVGPQAVGPQAVGGEAGHLPWLVHLPGQRRARIPLPAVDAGVAACASGGHPGPLVEASRHLLDAASSACHPAA